ncbi:hypothetical protein ACIPJK_34255 [Streptomyces roseus]|uniref:hypothetical protein n=1 Tax=Streptomyces roseus TaxID=66430 RepID=UPI00380D51A5
MAKPAGVSDRQYKTTRFGYLALFRNLPLPAGIGQTWFLGPDMAYAFPSDDGFNPVERLVFSAAARDESVARHTHLFAQRLIGPVRFLNPVAPAKASAVNIRHRGRHDPARVPVSRAWDVGSGQGTSVATGAA